MREQKAVILLSGGLDSATILAIAGRRRRRCFALSFDYGQRHEVELRSASAVALAAGVENHTTFTIDLRQFGASALTADIDVPRDGADSGGIPVTYVPARNTIFLSIALGYAEAIEASEIWIGVNAVDYSGYPDCRPAFIEAFQQVVLTGTRTGIEHRLPLIVAPLLEMSKREIIALGTSLGVDYSITHSCYDPGSGGLACGHCDSCILRRQGFADALVPDPTRYD